MDNSTNKLFYPHKAKDGSDHYEMRCRYCRHGAYLSDERGILTQEQLEKAWNEGTLKLVCPHCKKAIAIPSKGA